MNDVLSTWAAQLAIDPCAAVDGVLTGRTARGALQRAEADDFFVAAMAQPRAEEDWTDLGALLDQALLEWLHERRQWAAARIAAYGASAFISQLDQALSTVVRLRPPRTAQVLVDDHLAWEEWLTPLRRRDWIDLLDGYDMALAVNQHDARFSPRWFARLADAAWGGPGWQRSLRTGLIGLRKLPHPEGAIPEIRVAAGLAHFTRHALQLGALPEPECARVFGREAAALIKIYYPCGSEHWQDVWHMVIEKLPRGSIRPGLGGAKMVSPRHWIVQQLESLGLAPSGSRPPGSDPSGDKRRRSIGEAMSAAPPTKEDLDQLIHDLRRRGYSEVLWDSLCALVRLHWRHAEASGESYSVVGAVHRVSDSVLRVRRPRLAVLTIQTWVLRALGLEPDNPYLWDVWTKTLDALGRQEDALAVQWETVRRFPSNAVVRARVAATLRAMRRAALAEVVLRDAIRDFPTNEYCRNQLAELLRDTARNEEAEILLLDTMRVVPDGVVCRTQLADLWQASGKLDPAETVLREITERLVPDLITFVLLARVHARKAQKAQQTSQMDEARERIRKALDAIEKALRIDRRNQRALEAQARIKALAGQLGVDDVSSADLRSAWEAVFEATEPNFLGIPLSRFSSGREEDETQSGTELLEPETFSVENDIPASDNWIAKPEEPLGEDGPASGSSKLVKEGALAHEVEAFTQLNFKYGNAYANWYAAGRGLTNDKPSASLSNELGTVLGCLANREGGIEMTAPDQALLEAEPGSYSLRLLATYAHSPSVQVDMLDEIGKTFPEMRNWHDWLRLSHLATSRQSELLRAARRESKAAKVFWDGRLLAIYPSLGQLDGDALPGSQLYINPDAFRQLVADVAIASASRCRPSVGSSDYAS